MRKFLEKDFNSSDDGKKHKMMNLRMTFDYATLELGRESFETQITVQHADDRWLNGKTS